MSAPQPEDIGLMAKMVGAAGGLLTLFGAWFGLHKYTHGKIDGKADVKALEDLADRMEKYAISKDVFEQHVRADEVALEALGKEIAVQRGNIGKLFDKIDEAVSETQMRFTTIEGRASDRHVELLNAIHNLKK